MLWRSFYPGDPVIYRASKRSNHPGPRAQDIHPDPHGERYTYVVDKFWRVVKVRKDGKLVLRTRSGKEHLIEVDSPRIRRPRWWERVKYRSKFP